VHLRFLPTVAIGFGPPVQLLVCRCLASKQVIVVVLVVIVVVNDRYAAVTGANTTDVSMETYLQLGSNSIVRLHSVLLASRLNRMIAAAAADDDGDDDRELRPFIRSSLLTALSTVPLRDVVSVTA